MFWNTSLPCTDLARGHTGEEMHVALARERTERADVRGVERQCVLLRLHREAGEAHLRERHEMRSLLRRASNERGGPFQ